VFCFTLSFTNVTEAVDSSGDTDVVQISNSEFRKLPQCRVAWHRKVRRDEGVDLQATPFIEALWDLRVGRWKKSSERLTSDRHQEEVV